MTNGSAVLLVSAAALIGADGCVLVQKRPAGTAMAGLWEFPGGKVEPGETPEAALARELAEELGLVVDPATLLPVAFGRGDAGGRALVLLLFACRRWEGEPQPLQAAELRWVGKGELRALPMPPADVPLVSALVGVIG